MKNKLKNIFSKIPLGMNLRNYLILASNPFSSMLLAKNKVATKKLLSKNGIATAKTILEIDSVWNLRLLENLPDEFVIKPSSGSGGAGILVLKKKEAFFVDPSGQQHSLQQIKKHIRKILDGEFSGSAYDDVAIIEERIFPSKKIIFKRAAGLPDIRVFCVNFKPVMAMMRYSTKETQGRANLSAGAIGLAIDIATGKISHVHTKKKDVKITTKDLGIPADFVMPKWEQIKKIAVKSSKVSGLVISGIDVILDADDNVLVLEINGRPGIEIQNVNEESLLEIMQKI
ncbi:MAG: sugar-transfer associated ATP-grasp domain-containing protein [bacterium]